MIFLDFDGTIVDVKPRYYSVHIESLGDCAPRLSADQYWTLKRERVSEPAILARWYPAVRVETYEARRADLLEDGEQLRLDAPFAGALDALDRLLLAGHRLTLVSLRRDPQQLRAELDGLGLTPLFEHVISARGGPSPWETKAFLLRSLITDGDWIVGDTEADVRAAHDLGLRSCAVACGIRTPEFLAELQPTRLVADLQTAATLIADEGGLA